MFKFSVSVSLCLWVMLYVFLGHTHSDSFSPVSLSLGFSVSDSFWVSVSGLHSLYIFLWVALYLIHTTCLSGPCLRSLGHACSLPLLVTLSLCHALSLGDTHSLSLWVTCFICPFGSHVLSFSLSGCLSFSGLCMLSFPGSRVVFLGQSHAALWFLCHALFQSMCSLSVSHIHSALGSCCVLVRCLLAL